MDYDPQIFATSWSHWYSYTWTYWSSIISVDSRYFDTTGDLVALLIALIAFAYLLRSFKVIFYNDVSNQLHHHGSIIISAFGVIILHYILSLYVIYFTTPTLDDADNFVYWAHIYTIGGREYWFTIGAEFFKQFLSIFYYVFGSSSLLLSSVTIFVFTASLVMFLKICVLLEIRIISGWMLVLFGGIPGFLLVTIEPYREMFLIYFLMTSIYYGFRFRLELKLSYLVYSIILMISFGLFHYATMAMAPFILLLILLFPVHKGYSFTYKKIVLKPFVIIVTILILYKLVEYSIANLDVGHVTDLYTLNSVSAFIDKVNLHTYNLLQSPGSSNYYWSLDDTSFFGFIFSLIKAVIYYMFKPFLWEVNSLSSLVLSLEAVLRFLLVLFSIIFVFKNKSQLRNLYFILLFIYLFIEFIMALGTANSGTASRHHLVAQWIVIVLGGTGLIVFIKKCLIATTDLIKQAIIKIALKT